MYYRKIKYSTTVKTLNVIESKLLIMIVQLWKDTSSVSITGLELT